MELAPSVISDLDRAVVVDYAHCAVRFVSPFRGLFATIAAVALLATACGDGATDVDACREAEALAADSKSREPIPDDGWRADLHCLAAAMARQHPNLFFAVFEKQFNQADDPLDTEIPDLTDYEIVLEFSKLMASVTSSRGGR